MGKKIALHKNIHIQIQDDLIKSGSQALFHNPIQAKELVAGKYRLRTRKDLIQLFTSPIIKPN